MLKRMKTTLVLVLALLMPANIQAQNTNQLNIAEVKNIYAALLAEVRDLDNRFNSFGGMFAQVRQAMEAGQVKRVKEYAGAWSDSLAWKWVLDTPSVMKYLNANMDALEGQIIRAQGRGGADNGQRRGIESGAALLRKKMETIEAAYTSCVFPGFVRAAHLFDKAHEIRETGYPARGDLQKAIFATSSRIGQSAKEHLASAYDCVDRLVMPLLAEPVFFKAEIACDISFGFDCPAPEEPDVQPNADDTCDEESEIGLDINKVELDARILDAQDHLAKLRLDLAELNADLEDATAEMEALAKRPPYQEPGAEPTFEDTLEAMVLDDLPQDMHRDVVAAAVEKNGGWTGDFTLQDLPPDLAARAWEYLKDKRRNEALDGAERLRELLQQSQRTRDLIALLSADIQAVEARITRMKSFRDEAWEEKVHPLNPCATGPRDLGELGEGDADLEAVEEEEEEEEEEVPEQPESGDDASLGPSGPIPDATPIFRPDGMDELRQAGLERLDEPAPNANRIWTDTNAGDPGITMLEFISFAIIDLGYRLNLPVRDLLASPDLPKEAVKMAFQNSGDVSP